MLKVLELDSATRAQAGTSAFDAREETRIVLQSKVEPIVLRFKPNQYPGGFAVSGNDDLLFLRFLQITREIVLDFGKWDFFHSGFAKCASHDAASDFGTIANI